MRKVHQHIYFYSSSRGGSLLYEDIPDATTLVSPATRTTADDPDGIITGGNLPSKHGIISGDDWVNGITLHTMVGSDGDEFVIVNDDETVIVGGANPANHAIRTLNGSTYFRIEGKSADAPFVLSRATGSSTDPENGLQSSAIAAGMVVTGQNIVAKDINFAGFFMNSGATLSGGDAVTPPVSSISYESITLKFCRVFGKATEGECFYLGSTSKTAYAIINNLLMEDCLGTDKGRDGLQLNNHKNAIVRNCTFFDVGKENTATQRALAQCQNGKFLIENCIFDTCPDLGTLSGHDITFRNCYFRWDSGDAGFIGDYYTDYAEGQRLTVTPVKILFDSCYFDPSVDTTHIWSVNEKNCDVEMLNCIISTRITTGVFFDNRGATPANSLIGTLSTNGNSQATITRPAFSNFTWDDFAGHGKLSTQAYHELEMGYRTPEPA